MRHASDQLHAGRHHPLQRDLWLGFVQRACDGQVRLAYGRLVGESELDASKLPLVYKSGTSRLHDNRETQLPSRLFCTVNAGRQPGL